MGLLFTFLVFTCGIKFQIFRVMHPFYALCVPERLGIFWSRILVVEKIMVTEQDWVQFQASLCGICG